MSRYILSRLAISMVLASALLSVTAFAQSQDSIAEAARRAREQKKAAAKPAKVITEDDVKPATPAGSEAPPAPGAAKAPAAPTPGSASVAQEPKDEAAIAALKEQIKQAQNDVDLLRRQLSLEQDNYFSKPDYTHDTAGKAKVDGIKQQADDRQQELDRLKAHLAELQPTPPAPAATAPKQ
jgi:DNA repair exonuclease SbcCD ATPase subunit